jgi:hypothetical protein
MLHDLCRITTQRFRGMHAKPDITRFLILMPDSASVASILV